MTPVPLTAVSGGITRLRVKGAALKNSLYDLLNAYVTMQGTIKGRAGTLRNARLSKVTKGLLAFKGIRYVFAHTPTAVPTGYQCVVLVNPIDSTLALKKIHFASPFMGFPYVAAEFTDGSVYHYWLQTNGEWTADTVHFNGDYISPTVDNGFAYAATRLVAPNPVWAADIAVALNDLVEPTVYNGYMFKAIAVVGSAPHTGSVEPQWPTTEAAQIQEFGDFGTAAGASTSDSTAAQQPGSAVTDRYGNPSVFSSQIGTETDTTGVVTADSTISIWQAGTLYQTGAVVQPSTGQGAFINAIPNGDFEAGDDGNWVFNSPWAISSSGAYQGTKCATFAGGAADALLVMTTYGAVTPGQSVTATAYVNPNNSGADLTMWLQLKWYDGSDTLVATTQSDAGRGGTGGIQNAGYQQVSVTGNAPAGATRCRVAVRAASGTSHAPAFADIITWNLETPAAVSNFLYEAVQAAPATSGSTEPTWPTVEGNTVIDGGVTWKAIGTSIITWQAIPIMKSGDTEPTWPLTIGGAVADGTMSWICADRRITDPKCPQSKYVAISSSKIFAGDDDIVAFCATTNPLDWSSANDAGFLPFGLNNYGSEPVAGLNIYRSNLVIFSGLGYQMWQTDEDPTNMAILDAQPVGCTYSKSMIPVNNDLPFLSPVGIRNIGLAGSNANLQAGQFGKQIDPLVKAFLAALTGDQEPRGLYYPGGGQYWLWFISDVAVLTINGANATSWSRYHFPYEMTDWTVEDGVLILRVTDAGLDTDLVWQYDEDTLQDDVFCEPAPPVLSGVISGDDDNIASLTWTAAGTEGGTITSYDIYQDGVLVHSTDGVTLAYNVPGLTSDTEFSFYVVANTIAGSSLPSNEIILDTGHPDTIIDVFTTAGTWTKRTGLVSVDLIVIAAGGGGNAGEAVGTWNDTTGGGGGGGSGGYADTSAGGPILAASLSATEVITVGTGGVGAPSLTCVAGGSNNLADIATAGGSSSFGTHLTATGGGGGGPITPARGGAAGTGNRQNGVVGGIGASSNSGGNPTGTPGGSATVAPGAGGGGGQVNNGPIGHGGTDGGAGATGSDNKLGGIGGAGAIHVGVTGTAGANNSGGTYSGGGGGGGGPGASSSSIDPTGATGGNGGRGGLYGAGGGGGGAAGATFSAGNSAAHSGAGGNGAPGIVVVINHVS